MNEWQAEKKTHSLLNIFYNGSKNEWMNEHVKKKKAWQDWRGFEHLGNIAVMKKPAKACFSLSNS